MGALTPELKEAEEISVEKGLSRQVNINYIYNWTQNFSTARKFSYENSVMYIIISDGLWLAKSWDFRRFHDCRMLFKVRRSNVPRRWMW